MPDDDRGAPRSWLAVLLLAPLVSLGVQFARDLWPSPAAVKPTHASPQFGERFAEPEVPARQPVAKNEDEINSQQAHSASLYRQHARDKPIGDDEEYPQPDEVVQNMKVDPSSLRCGEKLPPESLVATRDIEIFVRSKYRGEERGRGQGVHTWSYRVEFKNVGVDTVQMLSRHWVFVDNDGGVSEAKGPGARGVTPVLRPGDSWEYESGTSLPTNIGSMNGSFQLEILKDVSGRKPSTFAARVGRLALSPTDGLERPPCGTPAPPGVLPDTSVRSTRRIIVGTSVDVLPPAEDMHRWRYDVQINNAREHAVRVTTHSWTVVDEAGEATVVAAGPGVGGHLQARLHTLPPGEAFRVRGLLFASTPTANAFGSYRVEWDGGEGVDAEVGVLGLSSDGAPVRDYRPEEDHE